MDLKLMTPEGRIYRPLPAQTRFHASEAFSKAYIGGFGSGKSLAGAVEVLLSALENPGPGIGLVARFDWDELKNTTWKTLLDITPPQLIKDEARSPQPKLWLKNGWEIRGYNLKRHQKLGSEKFSIAWMDECCEGGVEESFYLQIIGRMRHHIGPGRILLTGNPGGHNWVWQRFFAHREDASAKRYKDHEGFRAGTEDNKYLPKQYIERMKETFPDDWLEKYFAGSFDVFEGAILDNFRPELHVVEPFFIPAEWPRYFSLDHGFTNPTAGLWAALDFDSNVVLYKNYYKSQAIVEENCRAIAALEAGDPQPEWRVIDPSTTQHQQAAGTVERLIDQYRKAGLFFREGNNDRKAGIARIKSLLQPDPEHAFPYWHPRKGEKGAPWLYYTSNCRETIWEAQNWRWKDVKPGAVNREQEYEVNNHAMAAQRYLALAMPRQVREPKPLKSEWARFMEMAEDLMGRPHVEPDERAPGDYIGG